MSVIFHASQICGAEVILKTYLVFKPKVILSDLTRHLQSHRRHYATLFNGFCRLHDYFLVVVMWRQTLARILWVKGKNILVLHHIRCHLNADLSKKLQSSPLACILYSPISEITNLLYNLFKYDIPDLWPFTSDQKKTSQEIEKKLSKGRNTKNPSGEQQRRIPLWDGENNRRHVTRMKRYRVITHSMNMTECRNNS